MTNELENLLNELIARGWKPRGLDMLERGIVVSKDNKITSWAKEWAYDYSLNDLCSLDSGLWLFVCKEGLYKEQGVVYRDRIGKTYITDDGEHKVRASFDYAQNNPNYRTMLSSIQKDKAFFICDNIKL